MEEKRNGLVNPAPEGYYKRVGTRYVVANTVEAVKELITRRERGEIRYEFIARKRNGDRVFAVEEVN